MRATLRWTFARRGLLTPRWGGYLSRSGHHVRCPPLLPTVESCGIFADGVFTKACADEQLGGGAGADRRDERPQ